MSQTPADAKLALVLLQAVWWSVVGHYKGSHCPESDNGDTNQYCIGLRGLDTQKLLDILVEFQFVDVTNYQQKS